MWGIIYCSEAICKSNEIQHGTPKKRTVSNWKNMFPHVCVYIYIFISIYTYIYIHTFEYVQTLVGSLQIHCGLPYLLPGPASCIPCCLYFAWRNLAIFVPRKCGFVGSRFYTLFSLQILSAWINRPLSTIGKPKGYKLPLEMLFPLS